MHHHLALATALFLGVFCAPARAAAQPEVPGCPYRTAPADSLTVAGNHHLPGITIWPRSFPPAYTGCVYLWFGTRLHSIARLDRTKLVDGVIDNLVEGVSDDSDLPPMVACRAVNPPADSTDCERFVQLWTEEFPAMIADINQRSAAPR